jgi:plasmid stability protein
MAALTIRGLDEAVVHRLKHRAKAHGRSLEAEVREILMAAAQAPDVKDFLALADRIAAMTPNVPQTDSVELLREDRRR